MNKIIENYASVAKDLVKHDIGLAGQVSEVIENQDFSFSIFKNSDLSGIYYENCNFSNCDFSSNNKLKATQFVNCNVSQTNFRNSNVEPFQLLKAINVEQAFFDNNNKFITSLEALREKTLQGTLEQNSFFYNFYRSLVRFLGGNIKWETNPNPNVSYQLPQKRNINKVIEIFHNINYTSNKDT